MHAGSTWLSIAVQNAMAVGAHQYQQHKPNNRIRAAKKRLWWAIILRDRIMPLALRRTPQVNFSNFDMFLDPIDQTDLEDDLQDSTVYNMETKILLAKLLNCQCQLALTLTPVLMLCYHPQMFSQSAPFSSTRFLQGMADVNNARTGLETWLKNAQRTIDSVTEVDKPHSSVLLYSELTFMHYK